VQIRAFSEGDSYEALTELLHRAYAALSQLGFRYLATHQDVDTTRRRCSKGECYLALVAERVVGTILVSPPALSAPHCAWYDQPHVAVLSQLAVDPPFQRHGFGARLLDFGEQRAAELGAAEVSVDTATGALHLIRLYAARGYRQVGEAQWEHTNYRSVLLSKRLV
jgi:ribosomal protein S18 acetylase RimI-like enzyme